MSWLATKYVWHCRDEAVKGSTRLVLLALALRVRKRFISTTPTSMTTLQRLTFLSDDQVRRCLDVLVEIGHVQRLKRGKYATYALAKMAGPLFACDVGENPQDAGFFEPQKTPQDAGILNRKMRDFSGLCPAGDVSSPEVRTRVPTTTKEQAAAADFLDWFCVTYRSKRGYPYRVKSEAALAVILELLCERSPERLQAMALLMFDAVRDTFITNSDYSLFVLQHKATYLEGIAVGNERRESVG